MREFLKKYNVLSWLMAIFGAILLWLYAINLQNPESTVPKTVELQVTGQHLLTTQKLSVINQIPDTVVLQVRGRRDRILAVNDDKNSYNKIQAVLDLSNISAPGDYNIGYTVNVDIDGVSIVQKTPPQIEVKVDTYVTESFPVKIEFSGELESGFNMTNPRLEQSKVEVTGPSRFVDTIDSAYVTVDRAMLKSGNTAQTLEIKLRDSENNPVSAEGLTLERQEVKFSATVEKEGRVPLQVSVTPTAGITADMINVVVSPASIKVAGDKALVDAVSTINLGTIDLASCLERDKFTYNLPITLPDGVKAEENITEATVTVEIKGMTRKKISLPSSMFQVVEGFSYVTKSVDVVFFVDSAQAENISAQDFTIVPNYSGEDPGLESIIAADAEITAGEYKIILVGKYVLTLEKTV